MKQVRIVATALFTLTRIVGIAYLATGFYSTLTFIFNTPFRVLFKEGKYFKIFYPFTQTSFLIGENNTFYIVEMLLFFFLYGTFFWLLGNIFKTFKEKKLFTLAGMRRLKIFYLFNFLAPIPFLILHIILNYETATIVVLSFLHAVVGVFAYFMYAIFKQGLNLQNEQDLFI